ncbi:hypothetical protein HZC30_00135 [Candidatus Woesearchaeota archaeon]|nr:hypothetical protein [Candidatus Woesearchaeota archaeon]
MATNYKLGFLTAAVLAACNAEETTESKTEAAQLKDNTPPTIEMKVYLISGPTYHPTLSAMINDNPAKESPDDYKYVLSSDGSIKLPQNKTPADSPVERSSDLEEVIFYENGKPVITHIATPENEIYASDYLSVDLERTDGEYTYQVKARDKAKNSAESSPLTLVFKNGYAFPKEEVMKDKTPPSVDISFESDYSKLCADISDFEPGHTGILEATLLDGDKVVYHYAANPTTTKSLQYYLDPAEEERFCLTNLPKWKLSSTIPGLTDIDLPTPQTLAAVKNIVVIAKDFAGNEVKIAYADTEDFKQESELAKGYEGLKKSREELRR